MPLNVRGKQSEHRFALTDLLQDGQLARLRYDWIAHNVQPLFAACVKVAEVAGDLMASPIPAENRLWFAEHLGSMFASLHMDGRPAVPYAGASGDLAGQLTWFLLRGIGITDRVIDLHCRVAAEKTTKRGSGHEHQAKIVAEKAVDPDRVAGIVCHAPRQQSGQIGPFSQVGLSAAAAILILLTGGIYAALHERSTQLRSPLLASRRRSGWRQVRPSSIKQANLRHTVPLSGSLRALNQSYLKAEVGARVSEVLVREGEAG